MKKSPPPLTLKLRRRAASVALRLSTDADAPSHLRTFSSAPLPPSEMEALFYLLLLLSWSLLMLLPGE